MDTSNTPPDHAHSQPRIGRRAVLAGLATTAVAPASTIAATRDSHAVPDESPIAADRPGNKHGLPVTARGELTTTVRRVTDDAFLHERTFRSDALAEHFGDPVFEFEPTPIAAAWLSPSITAAGGVSYTRPATEVIGTPAEHARAETTIKAQRTATHPLLDDSAPASDIRDDLTTVPLYNYASKDTARADPAARAAPTNIAITSGPAPDAGAWMESACDWTSGVDEFFDFIGDLPGIGGGNDNPYAQPRFLNYDGDIIGTDRHVMKRASGRVFSQLHARLYDVSDHTDAVDVVGQVHRDPADHNKLRDPLPIDKAAWEYTDARDAACNCWASHDSASSDGPAAVSRYPVGRGDVATHDGRIAAIQNNGFQRPATQRTHDPAAASATATTTTHPDRPCACLLGF
ncbi:hypothetical protein KVP04_06590 [Halobacterium salinarum]|uniref:hypothetical protein n=1 Tax=Halobacterium salinarum TaxID=2242 RepID=UPI001F2A6046|nr:hypothetical protein [Halobacterium salinarum]MCF2238794.1 hypothetical protein [Halobacterium salinarum]